ncbi:hypothetical protein BST61_g5286 [Cercospora zeina]
MPQPRGRRKAATDRRANSSSFAQLMVIVDSSVGVVMHAGSALPVACMMSSPNGPGAGGRVHQFQRVPTNPRERWRLAPVSGLLCCDFR